MKKIVSILLVTVLVFAISASLVLAADRAPRLVDDADLLTNGEESRLLSMLDEISERQQLDVIVVTADTLGGKSPAAYADDYFDYNGYGFGANHDGVLLLVSMEDRDWYISTTGYGITAFTDKGIEYMSDRFIDDLSAGWYADAFSTYAELCDDFITQAKTGAPYDRGNLPKEPFPFGMSLIIAIVIGLVVAFIVTGSMKAQLKSVRFKAEAKDYVKKDSLQITEARDFFLYRHVSRVKKDNDRSGGSRTHVSSSGRSHGGGGGKF
jgi:uncharacterized protein